MVVIASYVHGAASAWPHRPIPLGGSVGPFQTVVVPGLVFAEYTHLYLYRTAEQVCSVLRISPKHIVQVVVVVIVVVAVAVVVVVVVVKT